MVRSAYQAVTMTLTTNVRMCIYINEGSASLYPTVIKNIIKVIFIAYFVLKYDKNEIYFLIKNHTKKDYQFYFIFQLNYVGTHFVMTV